MKPTTHLFSSSGSNQDLHGRQQTDALKKIELRIRNPKKRKIPRKKSCCLEKQNSPNKGKKKLLACGNSAFAA